MRRGYAGDGLNARLGRSLKGKRLAKNWKALRRTVFSLLLILAVTLAALLLFVWV